MTPETYGTWTFSLEQIKAETHEDYGCLTKTYIEDPLTPHPNIKR